MFRSVTLIGLLQAVPAITIISSIVTGIRIAHRNLELFSHFRLQYLIVSLLFAFANYRWFRTEWTWSKAGEFSVVRATGTIDK